MGQKLLFMRLRFFLFVALVISCGQLMAQDYIIDNDSAKHSAELKKRLPLTIKAHFTEKRINKWLDASEILGYYDSQEGLYYTAEKVQNADYSIFLPAPQLDSEKEDSVEHSDGTYNWISFGNIRYYEVITYGPYMASPNGIGAGRSEKKEVYLVNAVAGTNRIPIGFLGDKLETRKLLIKYFRDNTSIVTKINTNKIKNTADGIKELVNEYIDAKLGKSSIEAKN